MAPRKQSVRPKRERKLKKADFEDDFFFMEMCFEGGKPVAALSRQAQEASCFLQALTELGGAWSDAR